MEDVLLMTRDELNNTFYCKKLNLKNLKNKIERTEQFKCEIESPVSLDALVYERARDEDKDALKLICNYLEIDKVKIGGYLKNVRFRSNGDLIGDFVFDGPRKEDSLTLFREEALGFYPRLYITPEDTLDILTWDIIAV